MRASHWLGNCPLFLDLSVHQRWRVVAQHEICPICLTNFHGHDRFVCKYRFPTSKLLCHDLCYPSHSYLLCREPVLQFPMICDEYECDCDDCDDQLFWSCVFPDCSTAYHHEPTKCDYFLSLHGLPDGLLSDNLRFVPCA